jgi:hypothetical protein
MSANPTEPPAAPVTAGQTVPAPSDGDGRAAPEPSEEVSETRSAEPALEEVELWWGAYSGWTMTPSFVVCLLLTGLIGWASWYYMPQGWVRISAVGASSVVWLVQLARWARRVFGNNYRLTTRRMWILRGFRQTRMSTLELSCVEAVIVERTWLERRVGVGRICLRPEGGGWPLVLEGVRDPYHAADLIRTAIKAARADKS